MSFRPVIPYGGLQGWRFLNRTLERQQAAFAGDKVLEREASYFRENISKVRSAEQLLGDRRLLSFALDAFGLGDDLKNRAFIRRILESPSGDPGALANKLADQRYREFARTFGFADPGGPRTTLPPRVEMIVSKWKEQRFGQALGTVDTNMRLALHARSEITRIAGETGTDNGRWFAVLGAAPLRQFFLTALGLPPAFSAVDIDKQVDTLRARLRSLAGVGEVSDLRDGANVEKLMRNFFLRSENEPRAGFQASALSLLSQAASATALSRRF